jgi:short-subunit dehydrogenase
VKNFKDKIIWITGASSGIGEEFARQANAKGATVILSARRQEELNRIKNSLTHPKKAYVLPLDMEAQHTFPGKVKEVIDTFSKVDLLLHNAGISQRSYAANTSMEVDRKLMEVNYFGTVALTKAILPFLQKQAESHIAVNSSLAGKFGFYERSAYSASKFALQGFFETLRLEEEEHNLAITLLCPIGIKTSISHNALDGSGKQFGQASAMQEEGMSAEVCVKQMISAIEKNKTEVIIGEGMQTISDKIKVLFPGLFWKMIRKKKP